MKAKYDQVFKLQLVDGTAKICHNWEHFTFYLRSRKIMRCKWNCFKHKSQPRTVMTKIIPYFEVCKLHFWKNFLLILKMKWFCTKYILLIIKFTWAYISQSSSNKELRSNKCMSKLEYFIFNSFHILNIGKMARYLLSKVYYFNLLNNML